MHADIGSGEVCDSTSQGCGFGAVLHAVRRGDGSAHDVSRRHPHVVVQELGSEIRTVGPRQRVEFRVDLKLFETPVREAFETGPYSSFRVDLA